MSHGRSGLSRKPAAPIAVVTEGCTGCAGAPVCVDCCPVEACIFWVPDPDHPPFGVVAIDRDTCIGCAKCAAKGPNGIHLDGCPWDAIDMVAADAPGIGMRPA
ncbi:MAG: 4Fe-4S ferredoxin [Acidobacteriota bacterium]|nr:4Fe-4S ferredoxin [Acidobacteriota bacterium]